VAWAAGLDGDPERSRQILAQLEHRAQDEYVIGFALGFACLGAGDREQAYRHYRQTIMTERPPLWAPCMGEPIPFPDLLETYYGLPAAPQDGA
jgi:hypothetical protein